MAKNDEQDVLYELNRLLADYAVMYVKLHRYSWYAKGEHVFVLQAIFKELSKDIKDEFDQLAAYILGISGKPFATMIKFVKEAHIEEATADDEEEEMMSQLIQDFQVIKEVIHHLMSLSDKNTAYYLLASKQKWNTYLHQWHAYKDS